MSLGTGGIMTVTIIEKEFGLRIEVEGKVLLQFDGHAREAILTDLDPPFDVAARGKTRRAVLHFPTTRLTGIAGDYMRARAGSDSIIGYKAAVILVRGFAGECVESDVLLTHAEGSGCS